MLYFNLGGTGTGKSQTMINKISELADKEKKICIIVPDQYSFEFDKKLYKNMGAKKYNDITVLSFSRLAKDIFLKYGNNSGEYATDLTKIALMYLAVNSIQKNESLIFYNRQAKSPLFIDSALKVIKELKWSNISDEELAEKTQFLQDSIFEKVNDISIIYSAYNKILSDKGYKDSLNDLANAARIAGINHYFKNTSVFIDEFQSFSGDELIMIDAIIADADELNVSLTMDELPKTKSSLFTITHDTYFCLRDIASKYNIKSENIVHNKAYRFKSNDIEFLSKNIFRPIRMKTEQCENIKIFQAPEVYYEIDFICAEIRKLIKEHNYHFNEIAIISRNMTDYVNILESAFARYNIPYFLDVKKPVMHKAVMLLVMSVFEITISKHPDTEAVLKYAKTGLLGLPYSQISMLENYCYKWNIDGNMWFEDFISIDSDSNSSINETRKKLIEPLLKFKSETQNTTGGKICEALYKLFVEMEIDKNISGIATAQQENETGKLYIAREQKQLWNVLIDILETMHHTLENTLMSLNDFRDLLRIMLLESTFANPPQTLDSVTVSSAERARLAEPKVVFVIGVNEGIFPCAVKSTGLFNDKDKSVLEKIGLKLSINTKHKIDEERFIAYTSLSAPAERLYITYPLSDSTGKIRFPSYIIEQIEKMFKQNIFQRISDLSVLHFCTTEKAAYYNYVQNYNKNDEYTVSLRFYLQNNDHYCDKLAYLDNLNENISQEIKNTEITKQLFGNKLILSASRFEDFNKCPFVYFCKKGLNIFPPQRIEINAMEQGNVIHKCMFDILRKYDKESFINQTENNLYCSVTDILDKYYTEILGGNFGKTARFNNSYKKLADTIVEVLIHLQEEFSQSEFVPKDFEIKILSNGEIEPIKLVSKNGTEIFFTGTIDRVDTYEKNDKIYVRVIDYKSGEKIFKLEDVLYGINMQMLLYLFTLTASKGKYNNSLPAGILYMPSKELEPKLLRKSSDDELLKTKEKGFKMNGILIDDENVLGAMEKNINGIYIPVKKSKDGYTKSSSLITKKQLENLHKYSENLLIEMADKLYDGKISAIPLSKGNKSPCDYCDYWSICGNENKKGRTYSPDSNEQIQKILNGDEEFEI